MFFNKKNNFSFLFTLIGLGIFFVVYFGALNFLQLQIESHRTRNPAFLEREVAVEKAQNFVKKIGLIPQEHKIWVRSISQTEDAAMVDYLSQQYYETIPSVFFPWKRAFGLQPLEGDLRQGDLWHWSVDVADDANHDAGFVINIASKSGEMVKFERSGFDESKNNLPKTTEEIRLNIATVFLQGIEGGSYFDEFEQNTDKLYQQENCSFFQRIDEDINIHSPRKSTLRVCGDRVITYQQNFEVPNGNSVESLSYTLIKVVFLGIIPLTLVFGQIFFFFFGAIAYILFKKIKKQILFIEWKKFSLFGAVLFLVLLVRNIFEGMAILYYNCNQNGLRITFSGILFVFEKAFSGAVFIGAISSVFPVVILLAMGRHIVVKYFPDSFVVFDFFFSGKWKERKLAQGLLVGALACVAMLILESLSIFLGETFLNAWSNFQNPLAVRGSFFHLFSSDFYNNSIFAAIGEEVDFRFFFITLLFVRYKKLWLAIASAALLWSFFHVTLVYHPFYIQQISLILQGILLGWVFTRFGLLETITAHFLFNVAIFITALSLEASPSELISLILVTTLPVTAPLLVYGINCLKKSFSKRI